MSTARLEKLPIKILEGLSLDTVGMLFADDAKAAGFQL
jgi:hypothetical protein